MTGLLTDLCLVALVVWLVRKCRRQPPQAA